MIKRVHKAIFGAVLAGLYACSPAAQPVPEPPPPPKASVAPPPVVSPPASRPRDRFAIASENSTGVEVAREILEQGGTAIDAAVVGLLVACSAHASSCGLGGGGAALVVPNGSGPYVVDFREAAPHGVRRTDHLSKHPPDKRRGVMIGVPGLAAGLWELHRRGGKLSWKELVGRAADVVEKGIPLSPYMAQALAWNAKWVRDDEEARRVFIQDAESRVGETLKNPALAKTLRALAEKGPKGFYEGEVAADVVAAARAAGSRITPADLAQYRAIVRDPLKVAWNDRELVMVPPPAAGGVTVAEVLGFVSPRDIKELEWGSGALVHVVAEAVRAAHADRVLAVGDPDFTKSDIAPLFDPEKLRAKRALVKMDATSLPKLPSITEGGTLHFAVVDDAGTVVSVTATLTGMFGSKVMTKRGFAMNDALIDFTTDDYGQRAATKGPNFPRGGARPVSSLVPIVVLKGGAPILALGGSGGLRAPNAVAQVILGHLAFGKPLAEAVASPRFHVTSGGALRLDDGLASIKDDLVARGEVVDMAGASFAAVTAISIRAEGGVRILEPVFDPRKGGAITVGRDPPVTTDRPPP